MRYALIFCEFRAPPIPRDLQLGELCKSFAPLDEMEMNESHFIFMYSSSGSSQVDLLSYGGYFYKLCGSMGI